ncbi:MAG: hypothetical protein LBO82_08985, partial [Synergistaceae bacterium]|nr:hypothetical protein [Synergistaceae bacterium]
TRSITLTRFNSSPLNVTLSCFIRTFSLTSYERTLSQTNNTPLLQGLRNPLGSNGPAPGARGNAQRVSGPVSKEDVVSDDCQENPKDFLEAGRQAVTRTAAVRRAAAS